MSKKYKNKYRIKSARLEGYDYTKAGLYFITICTQNRKHYFGDISDNKMQLSNIGVLADVFWYEIKNHAKNVELHQFTVMPNHIHGILEILDGNTVDDDGIDVAGDGRDVACNVSTTTTTNTTTTTKNHQMSKISPKSGSVSRIFGSYKSAVSKHAHRLGYEFEWQERFYDHIIRNKNDYIRVSNYIENNPANWDDDKFNNEI